MSPLFQKHKKIVMVVAIGVLCLLLAGLRWMMSYAPSRQTSSGGSEASAENANTPFVRAFLAKKVKFIDNLVLTGTLQGGARIELRFNRDGRIGKINYRVGDKVKKGAVIIEMETAEASIRLQQAESELSQTIELYRSGAVAKPRLTQSQLAAQLAREEYNHSFIKAPRDGSIGEMNTEVGEHVTTQVTVATLVSVDTVFVEMGIIEKDLGKLHMGQTVNIEVETYPGVMFEGKITNISPVVEGTSRTRSVRAEIPNPKSVLLPGMFARTKIFIMEKPDTMVVPAPAIQHNNGEDFVFLLQGSKVASTPVKIGYESLDYVEILSGLSDGDRMVAQAGEKIRDGLKVQVIEEISYGEGAHESH